MLMPMDNIIFNTMEKMGTGELSLLFFIWFHYAHSNRISQVFLVCDETVDELQLTADGDSEMPLTYVG